MDSGNNIFSQAIKQISIAANSDQPLKKVLDSIARSCTKAMKAAGCSVMLLSPHKEHLSIIAAYGLSDMYLRKGALNAHKSLPEVLEGQISSLTDISSDERAQYPEAAELEKIKSVIGVPLTQKNEIIGELRVYTQESRNFSGNDKDFLSTAGNMVSIVLERYELQQILQKKHVEIVQKRRGLIETPRLPLSLLKPSSFGHPSEGSFARLLDFYKIEWLYEPRSFPIAWNGDNKVTEMFTPDFYLPEFELYIELTTLRQSLITEKNRKLRRVKELYPEINIKLLNKNDYLKMLAKYGYGPLEMSKAEGVDRVLFSHAQIQQQVKSLGKTISHDYLGKQLVLVGVLKGVVCFMADLMRHISVPLNVEFMAVSTYGDNKESAVKITKDIDKSISGVDVLIVEDIVDTGMTLNYLANHLLAHSPSSLKICTLLDKRVRRIVNVPLNYIGFEIPDEFVVGYGLDFHGEYRNLPYIGALSPNIIDQIKTK
jgi:bifunctional protein TilS/HprT